MSKKIMSPDSNPEKPCVGNKNFNYLWLLYLAFSLEDDGTVNAKEYI